MCILFDVDEFSLAPCFAETINVIVNKSVKIDSLDDAEIRALFLAKRNTFASGESVVAIDYKDNTDIYEKFYKKVVHKNISELNSYWSRKVFTGGGVPPRQVDGKNKIIDLVASNPQYLAYVEGEVSNKNVKVVYSLENN